MPPRRRLSGQPFSWLVKFVSALTAEGLRPEMAEALMNNRIAMQLWIASANDHIVYTESVVKRSREKQRIADQEAFLAALPGMLLEDLIVRRDKYYMSVRVYNGLKHAGVATVTEISELSEIPHRIINHAESFEYLRMLLGAANLPVPEWLMEATPS